MIAQAGLYYMAYQSGIKDENTVRKMEKIVKAISEHIKKAKAYSGNTVKMNPKSRNRNPTSTETAKS